MDEKKMSMCILRWDEKIFHYRKLHDPVVMETSHQFSAIFDSSFLSPYFEKEKQRKKALQEMSFRFSFNKYTAKAFPSGLT